MVHGHGQQRNRGSRARVADAARRRTARARAQAEEARLGANRRRYMRLRPGASGSAVKPHRIRYDLQFVNRDRLLVDWQTHLSASALTRLAQAAGVRGSAAALAAVRDIEIPLPVAISVFVNQTLSGYVEQTRTVYPQF